jgi:Raf kinase inhibitor-like YbhB/YbcL family protein
MQLSSTSISDAQPIAPGFAFCNPDPETHVTLGPNRSPQLAWEGAPEGTRSFAIVCCDPDVPSKPDDVNQEGRRVPADLPRIDFYHWVLVDIPAEASAIEEGADSSEVTAGGKGPTAGPHGARRGINSYTDWFAGDADMGGDYYGYDGPCPPWNDSIPHHYVFTVYALDMEHCPVEGQFGGPEVLAAIAGHVLAQASITCTYSVNPDVPA